jgi:hypothetical protein
MVTKTLAPLFMLPAEREERNSSDKLLKKLKVTVLV